jgi:3-oxoacyl-[acyl-carrier protein] reductase
MGLLEGKVAIVTGGAQGIGAAIALGLAKEGATVAVLDVNLERASATAKEFEASGLKAKPYQVDVSSFDNVNTVFGEIIKELDRVDILVNNAGVTRDGLLIRMSEQDWDTVIAINLKGVFNCTKAVARQMIKQKSGNIVNIASVVGLFGNAGQFNYAASKAGVIGATKASAKELATRNIRVNAVAPGYIQTAMTASLDESVKTALLTRIPAGRLGVPEDVAAAVVFLASDLAQYITGEVLRVDGGMAI